MAKRVLQFAALAFLTVLLFACTQRNDLDSKLQGLRQQIVYGAVEDVGAGTITLTAGKSYSPPEYFDAEISLDVFKDIVIPSSIPVVEGDAFKHRAELTYARADGLNVVCIYQGDGASDKVALAYWFQSCEDGASPGTVVAVNYLKLHVRNGKGQAGPTSVRLVLKRPVFDLQAVSRLLISPEAVLFTGSNQERLVTVKAYNDNGDELSTRGLDIEWLIGGDSAVKVNPSGVSASLKSTSAVGTTTLIARSRTRPELVTPPLTASVVGLQRGIVVIDDDSVILPQPGIPSGANYRNFELDGIRSLGGGRFEAGSFSSDEILPLLDVATLSSSRVPVVMRGSGPEVGDLAVGDGGSPIVGRVLSKQTRDGYSLLQIESVPPTLIFKNLKYNLLSQPLREVPDDPIGLASAGISSQALAFRCEGDVDTNALKLKATATDVPPYTLLYDVGLSIERGSVTHAKLLTGITLQASPQLLAELQTLVNLKGVCELSLGSQEFYPPGSVGAVIIGFSTEYKLLFTGDFALRTGNAISADWHPLYKQNIHVGVEYTRDGGWRDLNDFTFTSENTEIVFSAPDLDLDFPSLWFEADLGMLLGTDIGLIPGGRAAYVYAALVEWLKDKPCLPTDKLCEVEKVPTIVFLQGEVGAELALSWLTTNSTIRLHGASLSSEPTPELLVQGVMRSELSIDALKTFLNETLKLPLDIDLKLFDIDFPIALLYKPVLANGPIFIDGVNSSVEPTTGISSGQDYEVSVGIEFKDYGGFDLFGVPVPSEPPFDTTVKYAKAYYLDATGQYTEVPGFTMTSTATGTELQGTLTPTKAFCEFAEQQPVTLHLVAYNDMFDRLETSNYLEELTVQCTPTPPSGQDLVVVNDVNVFDLGMADANNARFVRNLVDFEAVGVRNAAKTVWFDYGRGSYCYFRKDCSAGVNASMISVIEGSGYTVRQIFGSPGSLTTILEDVKVVFFWNPTQQFTAGDVAALKQFAGQGGRVVFVGEWFDYYDPYILIIFLLDMGTTLRNIGGGFDCAETIIPSSSIVRHQVTEGLSQLTMGCSSALSLGSGGFPLYYDTTKSYVLTAVTAINPADVIPAATSLDGTSEALAAPPPGLKLECEPTTTGRGEAD